MGAPPGRPLHALSTGILAASYITPRSLREKGKVRRALPSGGAFEMERKAPLSISKESGAGDRVKAISQFYEQYGEVLCA